MDIALLPVLSVLVDGEMDMLAIPLATLFVALLSAIWLDRRWYLALIYSSVAVRAIDGLSWGAMTFVFLLAVLGSSLWMGVVD